MSTSAAANASTISSMVRYLPVPRISRELKVLPAITRGRSSMLSPQAAWRRRRPPAFASREIQKDRFPQAEAASSPAAPASLRWYYPDQLRRGWWQRHLSAWRAHARRAPPAVLG